MELVWAEDAKASSPVGRNDPCPCGSGKKYKRCCLGKVSARRLFYAQTAVKFLSLDHDLQMQFVCYARGFFSTLIVGQIYQSCLD